MIKRAKSICKIYQHTIRLGDRKQHMIDMVKYSSVSTGKLNGFRHLHTRPINLVVFQGSHGILILEWASRLDAFSGYPFPT